METAAKILVLGGVLNLAYGFFTGLLLSNVRRTSPEAPRYLVLAHLGPLMQGAILLGLAFAVALSDLPATLETLAASLLVANSVALAAGDTLNWRGGVRDAFAERPAGFYLDSTGAILFGAGLLIVIIGVLRGL